MRQFDLLHVIKCGCPLLDLSKPWCWFPSIFFTLHWLWDHERSFLTHDPFNFWWKVSRVLLLLGVYVTNGWYGRVYRHMWGTW